MDPVSKKGPKLCQRNIPPYHYTRQDGAMFSCCSCQIVTLIPVLQQKSAHQTSQDFPTLLLSHSGKPVQIVASVCSSLPQEWSSVAVASATASRFNSHAQRCSSACLDCSK